LRLISPLNLLVVDYVTRTGIAPSRIAYRGLAGTWGRRAAAVDGMPTMGGVD